MRIKASNLTDLMKRITLLLTTMLLLFVSCMEKIPDEDPLKKALASNDPKIRRVVDHPEPYEVQILFTRIDRNGKQLRFTDYSYQLDDDLYFYPASTVKLAIAVLALERLNEIDSLNIHTRFFVEGDTLETTFAKDIISIFSVSDNDANNRLMEFLGQDAINSRLAEKNIGPVRISHRLGVHTDDSATKPLLIYLNDSTVSPTKPTVNKAPEPLLLKKIAKGEGYYEEDSLYRQPFDFSLRNYYPISSQHAVLKRVIFPDEFPENEQFHINKEQRSFLMEALKTLPRKAGYDEAEFYDSYCKFFIFGDKKSRIPDHIEIYNKVGFAYGTLTDCAYIKDSDNGVEFMLTATILVNSDGIFNDDQYEYDDIGIPFLAALGRQLYDIERNRKK